MTAMIGSLVAFCFYGMNRKTEMKDTFLLAEVMQYLFICANLQN